MLAIQVIGNPPGILQERKIWISVKNAQMAIQLKDAPLFCSQVLEWFFIWVNSTGPCREVLGLHWLRKPFNQYPVQALRTMKQFTQSGE